MTQGTCSSVRKGCYTRSVCLREHASVHTHVCALTLFGFFSCQFLTDADGCMEERTCIAFTSKRDKDHDSEKEGN